ncbi:MAG: HAD family hydrolase [Spirochaetaceae bacterium]
MTESTLATVIDTGIWDFNGTLLDDLDLTIQTINRVLAEYGVSPVDTFTHKRSFRFPIIDYYRDLGLETTDDGFAVLSERYHDLYMRRVAECSLYRGIPEVLAEVGGRGVRQFVLSALNQSMLDTCITSLGITARFEAVYGLSDVLGRSKILRGTELIRDYSIRPAGVLYVGDTNHDVEVATELGFKAVAVSWGHQHAHQFDARVQKVVNHPSEILECLS